MNDLPLISVLIPVYNGGNHLAACIESILEQTLTDFELVIVDDGSTDGSLEIARGFAAKDKRVRVIPVPHGGRCRARNLCIAAAQGEYIAWQDMDDVSLPARLDVELAWLKKYDLDIVGSCAQYIGSRNNLLWFPQDHADIQRELLFRASLLQPTCLLKAEIARTNPFNEDVSFEDYEMWTRLAPRYRMGNVPQVLFLYRSHENQSHLLESLEFHADLLRLSAGLFAALFPQSMPEDREALARLVARQPAASLAELALMGAWLARFSKSPDRQLCQRMADRWRSACLRSAHLGLDVLSLYRNMLPTSRNSFPADLVLLCLLRVRSDSPFFLALRLAASKTSGLLRRVRLKKIRFFQAD